MNSCGSQVSTLHGELWSEEGQERTKLRSAQLYANVKLKTTLVCSQSLWEAVWSFIALIEILKYIQVTVIQGCQFPEKMSSPKLTQTFSTGVKTSPMFPHPNYIDSCFIPLMPFKWNIWFIYVMLCYVMLCYVMLCYLCYVLNLSKTCICSMHIQWFNQC